MRLKKREILTSRREMNVQEGDGVKKRESLPPKEGDLTCMHVKHKFSKLLHHFTVNTHHSTFKSVLLGSQLLESVINPPRRWFLVL